jgi:hypothetical protein
MAPLDLSDARPIQTATDFERLLREAEGRPDLVVALHRKSSCCHPTYDRAPAS